MTRERILELLELLAVELGNRVPPPPSLPKENPAAAAEWAYVKGLAAGAILRLRSDLKGVS